MNSKIRVGEVRVLILISLLCRPKIHCDYTWQMYELRIEQLRQ